jgi:CDP-glucose 4,6-dehydratase
MFKDYYRERTVLVTGHTGFKGGWLALWLKTLGANVWGLSLPSPTNPNFHEILGAAAFVGEIECDIRDLSAVRQALKRIRPTIVFHLAAQSIVRRSYVEPLETLEVNALGTAHILEAIRLEDINCICVVITSDKCYENKEWEFAYRENDPLGGYDVYSMSKAVTELIAQSWNKSFFTGNRNLGPIVTVRAGNVIGGGDYAVDRIVPDCIRALVENRPILVRHPFAVRPWQHVLECLSGYLWLGARLAQESRASKLVSSFNFGPEPSSRQSVRRLVEEILACWPGKWEDASNSTAPHEAHLLSLSIEKAGALLGWYPVWDFGVAVRKTVEWYSERHHKKSENMLDFSTAQITSYVGDAMSKKVAWAVE